MILAEDTVLRSADDNLLRTADDTVLGTAEDTVPLDLARWDAPANPEELRLLEDVRGPVIELGCGPGRLVLSLAERGIPALGIDLSATAVELARKRGASVLRRCLFEHLPGEGTWATALLFDGSIGIGGNPRRLLARCRDLLSAGGRMIAEVGPPGTGWRRLTARVERHGDSFPWAIVGADALVEAAAASGFGVVDVAAIPSGRWFVHLAVAA